MYCKKCHNKLEDGQLFCPNCGTEVRLVPDYTEFDEFSTGIKGLHVNNKKRKNHILKIIYLLLLIIFILTSIIIYFFINNMGNTFEKNINKVNEYSARQDISNAKYYLNKAIEKNDKSANSMYLIGLAYANLGDNKEAIKYLKNAIDLNSEELSYYEKLFFMLAKEKDYKDISDYINKSKIKTTLVSLYGAYLAKKPIINISDGNYSEPVNISITAGSKENIYYTLDGSKPTKDSTKYTSDLTIDKEGNYELKAIAINSYDIKSEEVSVNFSIKFNNPDSPIVTPETGSYSTLDRIIVDVPNDCTAYYTWDGTIPTKKSKKYDDNLYIKAGSNIFTVVIIDKNNKVSNPTVRSYDGIEE